MGKEDTLIPVSGQGLPLPGECAFTGAWIDHNSLFLYRSSEDAPLNVEQPTAVLTLRDGTVCHGINAATLSKALGMDEDQLFNANLMGNLTLVSSSNLLSSIGMRYVFRVAASSASVTIKYT